LLLILHRVPSTVDWLSAGLFTESVQSSCYVDHAW